MAIGAHRFEFLAIKVVSGRAAFAEKQPVASFGAQGAPFMRGNLNGAMPVPGPIMMIGTSVSGRRNFLFGWM